MKKFHYRGFHVRFGRYKRYLTVHGYTNGNFDVTVSRAGGLKHRYSSGRWSSGKRWVVEQIKRDIDNSFYPTLAKKP